MRILLVGNANLKHRGGRYYDHAMKLYNGFVRNGHNVFFLSDRDTARSATPFGVKAMGEKFCNQYFLDVCKNFQPEFIVLCHADIIKAETVAEAKKLLGVKVAQFNVDPIFREHNMAMVRSKLDVVDGTFITTAGAELKRFSSKNGFVTFTPNPVDPSIDWPKTHESSNQPNDVFWALRPTKTVNLNDPRIGYPLFIEESKKVKIKYYGMNGAPTLMNADYYKRINDCKMGLNISVVGEIGGVDYARKEELYLYSSDRIAQYMGSGLLVFTTRDNSLEEMFDENKEAIFFKGKEELLDKLIYYKNHDDERKKIANAGYEKSHKHLNERLVAQYIVEATLGSKLSNYIWPVDKY
jgi:Glycosyl transferases group 1